MLGFLRRSQRWFLWAVIVLVGGVFVLYLGIGGPPRSALPEATVLDIDGRRYTIRDVQRVREAQEQSYRETLGDDFDPQAVGSLLDQVAVSALEGRAYMAEAAERAGLHASDAEVRRLVRRIPGAVDAEGRLDAEAIRYQAEVRFGTERRFVQDLRDSLLQEKFLRLASQAVDVSPAEAREAIRRRREEVRLAYVTLDAASLPGDFQVTEEAEARVLEDEERLRSFYERHPERFRRPERARARHILIRVASDAPPEEGEKARKRAADILARLRAGADFGELAREESEDPGTREMGGDLGLFVRGEMAPALEEAAFGLAPGELSEPVRTSEGFHVLRLEERLGAEEQPFEEVRTEIARELAREETAAGRVRALADRLAAAVREGRTLEDAARAEGLTLERTDWIRRNPEGRIPGLGAAPEVLATAFALPEDRSSADRVFDVDGRLVLVQRLERRAPTDGEIEGDLMDELARLTEERRAEARQLWLTQLRAELEAEGRVVRNLQAFERP